MWIIYALLSAIFAAGVAIFGKLGLKGIDSTLATTVRAIIMALFLVGASLIFGKFNKLGNWSGNDWGLIVLAGISGAVSWLFYFLALKYADASKAAAIDRTSLAFIAIFAVLLLGEKLRWETVVGVLMVVGGAIVMTL